MITDEYDDLPAMELQLKKSARDMGKDWENIEEENKIKSKSDDNVLQSHHPEYTG